MEEHPSSTPGSCTLGEKRTANRKSLRQLFRSRKYSGAEQSVYVSTGLLRPPVVRCRGVAGWGLRTEHGLCRPRLSRWCAEAVFCGETELCGEVAAVPGARDASTLQDAALPAAAGAQAARESLTAPARANTLPTNASPSGGERERTDSRQEAHQSEPGREAGLLLYTATPPLPLQHEGTPAASAGPCSREKGSCPLVAVESRSVKLNTLFRRVIREE
ncbi:hypothetical protein NDU88_006560 [Pleurodeles waltl]|uniref:Uncharacterized protein n=1 Tax=Pleurodeles waltl TaxID=8319 RepID=A0AAV7WXX7_PLEWA|nr:hypothetical protein NDU88_006560 [Pleurodeles waltl]